MLCNGCRLSAAPIFCLTKNCFSALAAGIALACGGHSATSLTNPAAPTVATVTSTSTSTGCDPQNWSATWLKDLRFIVLNPCRQTVGTVYFVQYGYDGDLTIHVKPDDESLLSPGNKYLDNAPLPPCDKDKGCLMVEITCQGPINTTIQPQAAGTCNGFKGHVLAAGEIHQVGDRIEIWGPWVEERPGNPDHHSWRELHGATILIISHIDLASLGFTPNQIAYAQRVPIAAPMHDD